MTSRAQLLRPSRAATWFTCSASIDMTARFPNVPDDGDNDIAEDGTACHWLAAEIWEGRYPQEGTLAPNGRVLTEEMFDAVDMYHGVLRGSSRQDANMRLEQPVDCSVIYPGVSGTPDAAGWNDAILFVDDLKFGFRFVEVWDNLQLVIYALAIGAIHNLPDEMLVQLTIIQPRSFHRDGPVRSWTTTLGELRAKFLPVLQTRAHEVMMQATRQVPNPGCRDCPGRHICIGFQNAAMTALEQSYASIGNELSPAALGAELRMLQDGLKKMEARISGLSAQAEHLLRAGKPVPGWVLAPTYARESWQAGMEQQAMTMAKELFGVDIGKPRKAITPNQARKLLPSAVVDALSHRASTGVKLTKQDPYEAKKKFGSAKPQHGA